MKLTKNQLRKLIKEEIAPLMEDGLNFNSREEAVAYVIKIHEDLEALDRVFQKDHEIRILFEKALANVAQLRYAVEK